MREFQKSYFNCCPLLDLIVVGTPTRETHPDRRAEAQDSAVASVIGIASGQRVYQLVQVNR